MWHVYKVTFSYFIIHKGSPQQVASHVGFGMLDALRGATPTGWCSPSGIELQDSCLLDKVQIQSGV